MDDASPEVLYIIRHAEKPLKPPLSGVDYQGSQNEHSLLPRGWQRSGALAALFHPEFGPMRAGLRTPTMLVAPPRGTPRKDGGAPVVSDGPGSERASGPADNHPVRPGTGAAAGRQPGAQ